MSRRRYYLVAVLVAALGVAAVAYAQEPAPTPPPVPGCVKISLPVVVDLKDIANAQTIAHARAAVAKGQARILHLDRADATAHRAASLRGIPTMTGFDRDEYPPAASFEGGSGADVAYIDPTDNRSAGSIMGAQLAPFCSATDGTGQAFILEP